MITWCQLGLQDANSPMLEEFIYFHDFTILILTFIIRLVGWIMISIFLNKVLRTRIREGQLLECVWTLLPALVLIQIAAPSLSLLYIIEETEIRALTLKASGHQWYWRYEYSDFWNKEKSVAFDSYITSDFDKGLRLLDVDNRTVLPYCTSIRAVLRSGDVLHSWALPRLGVKADCCPGRLNQVRFVGYRSGLFYGQCSEICGANHRFIPICLELVSVKDFLKWLVEQD